MEESFLNRIFRILVRRNDSTGNSIRASLVQPHQGAERRRLATLRSQDERTLVGRRFVGKGCGAVWSGQWRGHVHVFPRNVPLYWNVAARIVARAG